MPRRGFQVATLAMKNVTVAPLEHAAFSMAYWRKTDMLFCLFQILRGKSVAPILCLRTDNFQEFISCETCAYCPYIESSRFYSNSSLTLINEVLYQFLLGFNQGGFMTIPTWLPPMKYYIRSSLAETNPCMYIRF